MREVQNATSYKGGTISQLCVGDTGGGKTAGLLTLKGRKFCYTFDHNSVQTLRGHDIDFIEFVPELIDLDVVTLKGGQRDQYSRAQEQGAEPRTYIEFEQDFEERLRSGFFNDYDVIGCDSATTLQDIVMDRAMYLNGRFGKWPEKADWTASMNAIMKILRTMTSVRKPDQSKLMLYLTAHLDLQRDDTTGKIFNQMNFIGKLKARVPLLFTNIWFCFAEANKEGKTQWYVRTQPDRYTPFLRTASVRGLDAVENVTIDDWNDPVGEGIGGLLAYKG